MAGSLCHSPETITIFLISWTQYKIKIFLKNGCLPLRLKPPLLPAIWNHSVAFQRALRSSNPLCLCTERIQQEATWWIRSDSLECFPCEAYKQVGNRLQTPGTQRATWEVGSGKGPPPSSFLSRHYGSIISSYSMLVERRTFPCPSWSKKAPSWQYGKIISGLSTMSIFHFEMTPFHKLFSRCAESINILEAINL